MTTDTNVADALAATLLVLAADYVADTRPVASKRAEGALYGAARAAHAIGYGTDPGVVSRAAVDYVRAHARPGSTDSVNRTWIADGTAAIAAALTST